jgi:putative CocE/NonD family hydrolase
MVLRIDPVGRFLRLPPPVADRIGVTRAIAVPMRDGVTLRTDHYAPAGTGGSATVLVRTPYGRGGPSGWLCKAVARRGFHVVLQSCRGTADSGGAFDPMVDERADGLDTIDWLARQEWYDGQLFTYGPSYVGFVQWAVAAEAGDQLKAMSTIVTASSFGDSTYAGGSFSLDSVLTWSAILAAQRGPRLANAVELLRGQPRLRRAMAHLPLAEADRVATGGEIEFFQRWLVENDPKAPYWVERGHAHRVAQVKAPVLMVGGWYDIFLPWQLADYAALRAAGARPYLTIGPWTHGSLGLVRQGTAESVAWFRAHTANGQATAGEPAGAGAFREFPVRVHVGGVDQWREYPDWPPPGIEPQRWYLQPDGGLARSAPTVAGPLKDFIYDPADPTPAVGGPRLIGKIAGRRDNRAIEGRADVLTFTTDPLADPVEAVGPVTAGFRVQASSASGVDSAEDFDVFVRLCDVDPAGRSWNVCDGLTRVSGPSTVDGAYEVRVALWPTAYRFRPGHRIRVQVSGGAHPRFARNPGTGAGLGSTGELVPVRQEILARSSIDLSVIR